MNKQLKRDALEQNITQEKYQQFSDRAKEAFLNFPVATNDNIIESMNLGQWSFTVKYHLAKLFVHIQRENGVLLCFTSYERVTEELSDFVGGGPSL